jgi:hypothetical protein
MARVAVAVLVTPPPVLGDGVGIGASRGVAAMVAALATTVTVVAALAAGQAEAAALRTKLVGPDGVNSQVDATAAGLGNSESMPPQTRIVPTNSRFRQVTFTLGCSFLVAVRCHR